LPSCIILWGKYTDAEHYDGLAVQAAEACNNEEKDLKLTMSYSLARLYEEKLEI
jgi:RNA polymerase-associated protein CTR9